MKNKDLLIIDNSLIKETIEKAKVSPRKRTNKNFHKELSDPINRMLNAIEPDTYVRPHKHEKPDKREVFIVLKGKAGVVIFNNDGQVDSTIVLSHESGNFAIEIPTSVWHTIVSLQTGTVLYEIKDGPYIPETDKEFANWAPDETDSASSNYLKYIIDQIVLRENT